MRPAPNSLSAAGLRSWVSKHQGTTESGQAVVIMAVFLVVVIGAVGMVLDVGSWYRADRAAQAAADAAALAGAQELIHGTSPATARANEYATKNGGGDLQITFSRRVVDNDLITVDVTRPAPGFFTKLFGIDSVQVHAHATARAGIPGRARYVAPITVNEQHPMLQCGCFNDPTQVTLINLHSPGGGDAAGAFGLLNLDSQQSGGNIGSNILADWIRNGYQDALPLGIVRLSPLRQLQLERYQGRPHRAARRRAALPHLPLDHRRWLRGRLRHHRLGRLQAYVVHPRREQRHAQGVLHAGGLAGPGGRDGQRSGLRRPRHQPRRVK